MIEARDYVRSRARFEAQWSVTTALIVLNAAVFVAQNAVEYHHVAPIYQHYALSIDGLRHGRLWQLITFQFLHAPIERGGVFHLLGNLFVIQVFGSGVEKAVGKMRFAALYLLSGVLGGLLQVTGGIFWPAHFGLAVVGASAGACGLISAFAGLFPEERLDMFFLPVTVRARTLLWLLLPASAVGMFLPPKGLGMAHCAHLGGILTGLVFVRWLKRQPPPPAGISAAAKAALRIAPALE